MNSRQVSVIVVYLVKWGPARWEFEIFFVLFFFLFYFSFGLVHVADAGTFFDFRYEVIRSIERASFLLLGRVDGVGVYSM